MDWHTRFRQQTGWTAQLRRHLFSRAGVQTAARVLDVGCGTGAILCEQMPGSAAWFGLDIDPGHLGQAAKYAPQARLIQGDAQSLPLADAVMDVVFCHFVLLWLPDPARAMREMARTLRTGGLALALAEPDYGGRIDYPPALEEIGHLQAVSLRLQGADPRIGRKLAELFQQAGFASVEVGVIGGQWSNPPSREDWETEWAVIREDLHQMENAPGDQPQALMEQDWAAWQNRTRILYVPTFYATGVKP